MFLEFSGRSLTTNDIMVHWLLPQTHIERFPRQLQAYGMIGIIHMLWMGSPALHHHATTIILVDPEFRKVAKFLGLNLATNGVMVHWLRSQTHMEWFPYPLQLYPM